MFISPFNKLMLSRYVGVSSIPVYELAFNGSMQVRAMAEAGLRSLMPEISRISANITTQAKNRISQLNSHAMKLIFFFGIPVYVVVVVFAPVLLRLWLGERFVETLPMAFRIMLIGTFLSLLGVPAYYTLMGMGYIRHNLASHIVQSVVNVAMILTSILFNAGVSLGTIVISTSAGMGVSAAYLIWQKRKTFNCLICETLTTNTSKS
jgi:O-antigen/teichoic acid export membrane protein